MREILSYARKPIPLDAIEEARVFRKGVRSHPLDLSHPLNEEKLIDIRELGVHGENYYHLSEGNPPYNGRIEQSIPYLLLRKSAALRLAAADRRLAPAGLGIHAHDCFRTISHQDHMFETWMPAYLKKEHHEWSAEQIDRETRTFWGKATDESGRINPLSPPLHATGGAADVTLRDFRTGSLLPMGCGFDDFSSLHESFTDHFERLRIARHGVLTLDEEEILGNRRLLYWTMTEEGFTNNPNEVWHFDLYDQMWAALKREEKAFYGATFVPFLD